MGGTKIILLVLSVFGVFHNFVTSTHSSIEANDWMQLVASLKKISHTLDHGQNTNPSNFTYEGLGMLARTLKETRIDLTTLEMKANMILFRLKKDFKRMEALNTTFIVPPKKIISENCSYPFKQTKLGCYWFHILPNYNFTVARLRCQAIGADLATVPEGQLDLFQDILYEGFGSGYQYVWAGAKQQKRDNTWKWIDGTPVTISSNEWYKMKDYRQGRCMAMASRRGYAPVPYNCGETNNFICEKKLKPLEG